MAALAIAGISSHVVQAMPRTLLSAGDFLIPVPSPSARERSYGEEPGSGPILTRSSRVLWRTIVHPDSPSPRTGGGDGDEEIPGLLASAQISCYLSTTGSNPGHSGHEVHYHPAPHESQGVLAKQSYL